MVGRVLTVLVVVIAAACSSTDTNTPGEAALASCEAEHGAGTEATSACVQEDYCRQEYPEGAAIAARLPSPSRPPTMDDHGPLLLYLLCLQPGSGKSITEVCEEIERRENANLDCPMPDPVYPEP
jgi:hypothetical protein